MTENRTTAEKNERDLEEEIHTDLKETMTYGSYLDLDRLLGAQHPVSRPEHHDEMLFIIQHQTTELWFRLVIHELLDARRLIAEDELQTSLKRIARVKHIQKTLTEQWSVLATLTPSEYVGFRDHLGRASGFQSWQYRAVEFLLGNKNRAMLPVFDGEPEARDRLEQYLNEPSIYDEFLACLARRGLPVPARLLDRDFSVAHTFDEELLETFRIIYENPQKYWQEYESCEELVDLEENFQFWRFRHMRTVQRIIGMKRGTGGSSGVGFLQKALDLTFFPELFDIRTGIENGPGISPEGI
ncbi:MULTISPECIES: tryptophan 2,3-dioxygenase family protein [unclassified Brevibacterium]|jgi:tryptophan 2,3-dioxygenase|uniref:tryptophan 2,3-dioxygenase n=1 Tax=unclassified Brevibacterium TaxID=2614124 RepID=UPI001BABB0C2|nr:MULTISPECIES: tryptophan 2,3-dioxygenase family protein [unclassified Brevibacterium]QUL79431.1 tryptophan 2,3-dioxygenase [Brevibacterium sp. SMBL_HHYL_HB1]HJA60165.1 tryptophan 2,3-dioxygenase [Candidatus Brevibacterium intestinavium]